MTTTLITGANKGLGFGTARRLVEAGHTVYLGSRDADRGRVAAEELGARLLVIDVTDDASVAAAAKTVAADGGLDVLINNAGVAGEDIRDGAISAAETSVAMMQEVFSTNTFGVVRVTNAFLPLLRASPNPVIVNVSSQMASLEHMSDPDLPIYGFPGIAYPSSKAALNMITVQYAKAFPAMRINAVEPGSTKTDLNGYLGQQSLEQGTEIIVRMAQLAADGPTGGYVDINGRLPW